MKLYRVDFFNYANITLLSDNIVSVIDAKQFVLNQTAADYNINVSDINIISTKNSEDQDNALKLILNHIGRTNKISIEFDAYIKFISENTYVCEFEVDCDESDLFVLVAS